MEKQSHAEDVTEPDLPYTQPPLVAAKHGAAQKDEEVQD